MIRRWTLMQPGGQHLELVDHSDVRPDGIGIGVMSETIYGWLHGDTPNVQGEQFPITTQVVIIGRGSQSQIQLSDPKISRRHARLQFEAERTLLEDLGSTHGTLVNGQHGSSFELSDGDVIAMGETLMVFKVR